MGLSAKELTRVLYFVSPIGLGHASRAVAIGSELLRMGAEVEFVAGKKSGDFISSYGFKVHRLIKGPNPIEREGVMMYPALWYFRYWLAYRSNKDKVKKLISSNKPDVVVGDEEFSSISYALENDIKHVMISDELELNFAKSYLAKKVEQRVMKWYSDLQRRTRMIIVPEFGEDNDNLYHVGPAVRKVTRSKEQVRNSLRLPKDNLLATFSMSGSGLGRYFFDRTVSAFFAAELAEAHLAISGTDVKPKNSSYLVHILGFVRDNHELIAASDLVISSAGKSTIDEARNAGTPIIAIPFKDHFEQEKNAEALGFTYEDIDRLDVLIQQHIGRRTEPQNYRGAEKAARMIIEL